MQMFLTLLSLDSCFCRRPIYSILFSCRVAVLKMCTIEKRGTTIQLYSLHCIGRTCKRIDSIFCYSIARPTDSCMQMWLQVPLAANESNIIINYCHSLCAFNNQIMLIWWWLWGAGVAIFRVKLLQLVVRAPVRVRSSSNQISSFFFVPLQPPSSVIIISYKYLDHFFLLLFKGEKAIIVCSLIIFKKKQQIERKIRLKAFS